MWAARGSRGSICACCLYSTVTLILHSCACACCRNMATVKKLKVGEIKAISKSICKPTSTTASLILEAMKKCRHILSFPERKKLCDLLEEELFDNFSQLVSCLVEDYSELYKTTKGRTKYSDFQIKWLDHIHQVAERGAALAISDAQDDSDTEYLAILPTSSAAEEWSTIHIHAQLKINEVKSDTNLIVLHSIAKQVFNHQQERVIAHKAESTPSSVTQPSPSPDDALLRMCGAEVARSLKSLKKERSRKLKGNQPDSVDTLNKEIALLKSMCVPNAEKSEHDDIPQGIKNLDLGYMWVPRPCLLPFLRKFDLMIR